MFLTVPQVYWSPEDGDLHVAYTSIEYIFYEYISCYEHLGEL